MSLSSTSFAVDALLERDVDGQYRPARAEEVLSHARRVLSQRVLRGATMSSPQAVKDHLRLKIGRSTRIVLRSVPGCAAPHRKSYSMFCT